MQEDRETLRKQIMVQKVEDVVIMPVNITRMLMNVKAIKGNLNDSHVTDLDPKHYFAKMKELLDVLVVVPEARFAKSLKDSTLI